MKIATALLTLCFASLAHAQVYDGPARQRTRHAPQYRQPQVHRAPVVYQQQGADFGALVAAVQRESFSSNKLNVIRMASGQWFSVAQVGQLVDLMSFSSDKVAVVELLRHRLVDPHNGFALLNHFTFSSDKERVMTLLAG